MNPVAAPVQIAGPLAALAVSRLTGASGMAPTLVLAAGLQVGTALWLYRQPHEAKPAAGPR
ncbi:hypothetical protein [Azohydromonas caseinilytica]|uniref:Uncharacterized protein n=1 Tax=Azohydromonas caseinilytica TaxID=2728836 RepID=A0A848FBV8_9BURK|nr:hypothetical protein [Azohydromonas caseinilytica]NML16798.1 hypothetical protein [Azohydromonas caseinilytica]